MGVGETKSLSQELKDALQEQIDLVFGHTPTNEKVPFVSPKEQSFLATITDLPDPNADDVFAVVSEPNARSIVSETPSAARDAVKELLDLHRTNRSGADRAQELRDLLYG